MIVKGSESGRQVRKNGKLNVSGVSAKTPRGSIDAKLAVTARKMSSGDYQERFQAEAEQLKVRLERLNALLNKERLGTLGFKLKCPVSLLERQQKAMSDYLECICERAEIEGIEI